MDHLPPIITNRKIVGGRARRRAMTNRGNLSRSMLAFTISSLVLSLIIFGPQIGLAQQGSFQPPPPTLPRDQHQGGGSTLEVPLTGHQPANSDRLPPIAPQNGQELSVAPQELRRQTGYQQVTVTVTNQHGGYQTGLQRDDFKLYIDGVKRPIEFFRHDLNTP